MMLISHADDLGLYSAMDAGLYAGLETGRLSEISAVVAAPDLQSLRPKELPKNLTIGLHLNLTEGRPVADPRAIPHLLSARGDFLPWPMLLLRSQLGLIPTAEVRNEFEAQIHHFRERFGTLPPHLDSHHHIHFDPRIGRLTATLAKKYGIRTIRAARNLMGQFNPRAVVLGAGVRAAGKRLAGEHFPVLDGLLDIRWLPQSSLEQTLMHLDPNGTYELIWHLGMGHEFPWRTRQLAVLKDPAWWDYLDAQSIELSTYTALTK